MTSVHLANLRRLAGASVYGEPDHDRRDAGFIPAGLGMCARMSRS
jgi:hypothetical protein